jgi:hypothetical protein
MIYACCDDQRRVAVEGSALNGIDYLEVLDRDAPTAAERQRTLLVRFVNAPAPALTPANLKLDGGERIRGIQPTGTAIDPADNHVLRVAVDQPGDFSMYTLRLVQAADSPAPPTSIDPALAAVEFSFKAECPSPFDCRGRCTCFVGPGGGPEIDYLAKDYASFRRLILDRIAAIAPAWRERSPADLGVAMVELLAYVGDHLSYQQDAIATEAYLDTARQRVSVRRHARLVDYAMHDGCNARAWVQLAVTADVGPTTLSPVPIPRGTPLCTDVGLDDPVLFDEGLLEKAAVVFETMEPLEGLFLKHDQISFYTWSDRECCSPANATSATLAEHLPNLRAGDVLVFEERVGPLTNQPGDADPDHRQAVRLASVRALDAGGNPLTDPLTGAEITEITWLPEDALRFPLSISARTDRAHGDQYIVDVSVARGNIVLVDHGRHVQDDRFGTVPPSRLSYPRQNETCERDDPVPLPPRFRPIVRDGPLTQCEPLVEGTAASMSLTQDPNACLPVICLDSTLGGETLEWEARLDLLYDEPLDAVFVAETEVDGTTRLRFGDGQHGLRPKTGTSFSATYRVGNGMAGNVGREAIKHVFVSDATVAAAIAGVRNPLPASGGVEPESIEDVRTRAPGAFRTLKKRAVTEPDYAEVTERHAGVQRAAATFRWTGSWHTVFLTVDRLSGLEVDPGFASDVEIGVEPYRMAGSDLAVDGPRAVSLEIELNVCVKPDYFRSDVKGALLDVFSDRTLADGRRGVFHPDEFTFGQTVYLSRVIAAAQAVDGVASVEVATFQRQGVSDAKPLRDGQLVLDRLEIARLDNDPSFPEHGVLRLTMAGGK